MTNEDIKTLILCDYIDAFGALVSRLNRYAKYYAPHANFQDAEDAAKEAISRLWALLNEITPPVTGRHDGTVAEITNKREMEEWLFRQGQGPLKRSSRERKRFRPSTEVEQEPDHDDDRHRRVARVVKEIIDGLSHPFPEVLELDMLPTLELIEELPIEHANLPRLILAVRPRRADDWQGSIATLTRFLSTHPEMAFMLLRADERCGVQARGIQADTFLAELIRSGGITPHALNLRTTKLVKGLEDRYLEEILDGQVRPKPGVTLQVVVHLAACQFGRVVGRVEGWILQSAQHGAAIDVLKDSLDQKLAKLAGLREYPLFKRDERRGEEARRRGFASDTLASPRRRTSRPPPRLLADSRRELLARHSTIALLIGGHDNATPRKLAAIGEELVHDARIALKIQLEERAKDDDLLDEIL